MKIQIEKGNTQLVKPSIANFSSHTAILKSSSWCAAFYQNIYIMAEPYYIYPYGILRSDPR